MTAACDHSWTVVETGPTDAPVARWRCRNCGEERNTNPTFVLDQVVETPARVAEIVIGLLRTAYETVVADEGGAGHQAALERLWRDAREEAATVVDPAQLAVAQMGAAAILMALQPQGQAGRLLEWLEFKLASELREGSLRRPS